MKYIFLQKWQDIHTGEIIESPDTSDQLAYLLFIGVVKTYDATKNYESGRQA